MLDFEFGIWFYCALLAVAVPIMIPALQFGVIFRLWDQYNKKVNRDLCQCSCWDTVFKAGYETGVGSYHHVYFNSTPNTLLIWAMTVAAVIALYEAVKKVFIALLKGSARPRMCILFLSVLFPHYYAWWAYFNYLNDDYYSQLLHQFFFTATELISTIVVLHLVDRQQANVTPRKILVILSVATLHVAASGWDQFVFNVLRGEGMMHQVLRDLGFMLPDLLHIYLAWAELKDLAALRRLPPSHLIKTEDFATAAAFVGIMWLVCVFIK